MTKLIENIQAQTFEDWELLMVDDDSLDEGGLLVTKAALQDSRIKALSSPKIRDDRSRIGPWFARNHGLKNAEADLVAFLDVDDLWHPQKLEFQVEVHENHEVGVTYTNFFAFDLETRKINSHRMFPHQVTSKSFLSHNPIPISTSMISKSLVGHGFKPTYLEDYCFWLEVSKRVNGKGIRNLDKTLCYYGEHFKNRNRNKFSSLIHSHQAYLDAGFGFMQSKLCCARWVLHHGLRVIKSRISKSPQQFDTIDRHLSHIYD